MIFVARTNIPVSLAGIQAATTVPMMICHSVLQTFDYDLAITSITDGHKQGVGGLHPWGFGCDFQPAKWHAPPLDSVYFHPRDLADGKKIRDALKAALFLECDLVLERTHYHLEVDVKKKFS